MMILDASVALAWCLVDERSALAYSILDRVAADGAAVPAHWPLEMANGLLSAERRRRIDSDGIADASRLLDRLPIEIVPVDLTTAAWPVLASVREHGLSAYDAAYLDLARSRGLPLATLDNQLRVACESAGIELIS
jgi:predicted nucleic acid-binding protein